MAVHYIDPCENALREQYADEEAKFKRDAAETEKLLKENYRLQSKELKAMTRHNRRRELDHLEVAAKNRGFLVASGINLLANIADRRRRLESLRKDFLQIDHLRK